MKDDKDPDMETLIKWLQITLATIICALALTLIWILKIIL